MAHAAGRALALGMLVLATAACGAAAAGPAAQECSAPSAGARLEPSGPGVYFGFNIDWEHDSPAAVARRLGHDPALFVAFAPFPLDGGAMGYVDAIAGQLAPRHAALMLTLEPNGGLDTVTGVAAGRLAARLETYDREGVPVFLRFAQEMNGSWYPWSQQPAAYVAAFRLVAAAVHRAAPATAMVWAPNYGGGYPFVGGRYAARPGTPDFAALDTNGDGRLTMADDPYAPYYPGDDAVDWVAMSLYHWGSTYPWGNNQLPEPGKFDAMLTGQYRGTIGDETAVPDFYDVYANGHHKPVAIAETAAFFAPGRPGDEAAIKAAWWAQVLDPANAVRLPRLAMIDWFEWDKFESEVGAEVDWTVTRRPDLAAAFAAALPADLRWAGTVPGCAGPR
jgi:hypothetical protein